MDGPRIAVSTPYGTLDVSIGAGPTSAPGHGYLSDHVWPGEAHAFGREPDAPYLYAFVRSDDGQLTINRLPYTVTYGRFALRDAEPGRREVGIDWREDYGSGPSLKRSDVVFGGEPTDAARKAWREVIAPAIVDALRAASQEATEAETIARVAFVTDCKARAAALRAEADRLDGLWMHEPPIA